MAGLVPSLISSDNSTTHYTYTVCTYEFRNSLPQCIRLIDKTRQGGTLEIRPGTRPATSGQFQFPGPNWPRVTPGDSPGHFPTPGGRFEDQFGSVQANFGPNSSPAGSNSSPTGFNSSPTGSKSSPAGSKSSPAGSFETRTNAGLVPGLISSAK